MVSSFGAKNITGTILFQDPVGLQTEWLRRVSSKGAKFGGQFLPSLAFSKASLSERIAA
jgi:hypothetical protein